MFRLTLAGPDTAVVSSLCGGCPYGPRGCCVAPPRYAWSDVARVVLGGGRDWLLAAIARGELPVDAGRSLIEALGTLANLVQVDEMLKRIEALEREKAKGKKS